MALAQWYGLDHAGRMYFIAENQPVFGIDTLVQVMCSLLPSHIVTRRHLFMTIRYHGTWYMIPLDEALNLGQPRPMHFFIQFTQEQREAWVQRDE